MARSCGVKTILTIEDEAEVLTFVSRVLELEGYRVLQASDGDTGLRLAREHHIALMLLDLRLPGRDGWSVLRAMKSELELSAIPVIVFTASAGVPQRDRALGMGAVDYLIKPLSVTSLREAVVRVLNPKR